MSVCKRYIKIAYAMTGPKTALLTRLRCKQWSCPSCADKNARTWQYWLIKRLPEISQDWYLITLTAHPDTTTEFSSLDNIRRHIDTLIKRAKRVWGDDIEYGRVYEPHPSSGRVHVHFIMTGITPYVVNGCSVKLRPMSIGTLTRKGHVGTWAAKTWFKKTCFDLKMGYMADVKRLEGDAELVAFYLTKYLTKDQGSISVPYLRHVQVTKGIGSPQFDENYQWIPASYITARTFEAPNTEITDIDTGKIINNDFWEHTGFYPNED